MHGQVSGDRLQVHVQAALTMATKHTLYLRIYDIMVKPHLEHLYKRKLLIHSCTNT